jgi:thiol:disulfide interchange protein
MHRFTPFIISFFAILSLSNAQETADSTKSIATFISEYREIAAGKSFTVALKLEHPHGWHSYYRNSGGIEQSPSITWTLPNGFTADPIQWPTPEVKDGLFGKSFVYSASPVFLVDIHPPVTLETGKSITLTLNASWQICKDCCIGENQSLSLTLLVSDEAKKDATVAGLFEKARAALPSKAVDWKFSASAEGENITLHVKPPKSSASAPLDFIPDQPFVKSASSGGSIKPDGDGWLIQLKRVEKDVIDNPIKQGKSFSGVLLGTHPIMVPDTVISTVSAGSHVIITSLPISQYLPIMGGMLLGGLILNLMPCVFPVIGLKIMGFVQQAGEDRKKIVLHGITFALGVLASFGVLSGILFIARSAAGESGQIGWGYQLQNPWVDLSLMLLMFLLALNMFGVFELGVSATSVGGSLQRKQGLSGSFFSGVLATVVATPCSAPFLGAAIGAAIALPAFQFFAAFAAMAIGLALPYLILSIFPKLIDFLPRPGAWMESFKQGMSFLLFATAGYLLWVYVGLIDLDNMLGPVFGLSAIAVAAWIHGRWNLPHRSRKARITALLLTLLFGACGIYLTKPPGKATIEWGHWSQEAVDSSLAEGKPVYIDFTAKWCATCQFNKKRAYTPEVVALMKKKGVVLLEGDKTKPDPAIEEALQKLGRSAIPVNVLIAPGKAPVILPELLSPEDVKAALGKL